MPVLAPPPSVNQDINSRQFRDWFYSIYALLGQPGQTLGTMAYQDANSVAITGGAIGGVGISGSNINSTPIGQTTAAAGKFTTLQATASLKTDTLTGYLYGNGSGSNVTASTTIPWSVITGAPAFTSPKYGAFHYDYTTTLTSSITNTQTTIPVVSTTGFSSSGDIIIEDEIISYTGITSVSFTGCTRGAHGSASSSHPNGSDVGGAQALAANTPGTLMLNTTDLSNGITLNTSTSIITVANAGTYNMQYSAQLANASNTADHALIWFKRNGSNIASTNSWATVPSKTGSIPGSAIITVNIFYTLAAGDTINLEWLSKSGNSVIVTYPPSTSPAYPASPAVIFTINQIA